MPEKTSPKIKKFGLPCASAWARTAGVNWRQNSGLTCFTVSTRKPSIPKFSTQYLKMSVIPFTTSGCSVKRSSRPKKSP